MHAPGSGVTPRIPVAHRVGRSRPVEPRRRRCRAWARTWVRPAAGSPRPCRRRWRRRPRRAGRRRRSASASSSCPAVASGATDRATRIGEHVARRRARARAGTRLRPVTASPAMSACCTGAAPRQRGSSEKCRLIQPWRGAESSGSRTRPPYATITPRSGSSEPTSAVASSPSRAASMTGMPDARPPRRDRRRREHPLAAERCLGTRDRRRRPRAGRDARRSRDGTAADGRPGEDDAELLHTPLSPRSQGTARGRRSARGAPAGGAAPARRPVGGARWPRGSISARSSRRPRRPPRSRTGRWRARGPSSTGAGPRMSTPSTSRTASTARATAAFDAVTLATRTAGGKRSARGRRARPGRSRAASTSRARGEGPADADEEHRAHRAPRGRRRSTTTAGSPRRRAGSRAAASARRRAGARRGSRPSAIGSAPRVAIDERGLGVDLRAPGRSPSDDDDARCRGTRGRARRRCARCRRPTARSFVPSQFGHAPGARARAAPARTRAPPRRGRASGPPQCGQRAGCRQSAHASTGRVARAGRPARAPGPSRSASAPAARRRRGCGPNRGSARRLLLGGDDLRASRRARGRDLVHPADLDQALDLGAARVRRRRPARRRCCSCRTSAASRACTHGAERLGEQRVAVVPDRDEAEACGGRVDGRAVADDDARASSRVASQERAVAVAGSDCRASLRSDRVGGDAGRRARPRAAPGRGSRARRGSPTGRRRGRARRPAPASPPTPRPTRPDGRRSGRGSAASDIRSPAAMPASMRPGAAPWIAGRRPRARTRRRPARREPRLLDAHLRLGIASRSMSLAMPAARSATARASAQTSGRSTGTGETTASSSLSGRRYSLVLGELDDAPVDDAPAGAQRHAHADAGRDRLAQALGNRVVEEPVELRQRRVDEHPWRRTPPRHVRARRQRAGRRRGRSAPR